MRNTKLIHLTIILALLTGASFAQNNSTLTIKQIMQGQEFVGDWPSGVYWSEDGESIYFRWNPQNADADSLYVVSRRGGEPRKVTLEEQKKLPARSGEYNRRRTTKVYSKHGDIFLIKIKSGKITQITNTLASESGAKFTHDEENIVFTKGLNLYLWNIKSGLTTQVTDFRSGKKKPEDEEPENENEKWVKQEEHRLIQTTRERKEKAERRKENNEALEPDRPLEIYLKKKSAGNVRLSPDQRYVTFRLSKEAKNSKRTEVPNYMTESGYTEELSARPKVGSPGTGYEFGIYDRQRDTVYYVAIDSIPGILDKPKYLEEYTTSEEEKDSTDSTDSTESTESTESSEAEKKKEKPKARNVTFRGPYWSDDGSRAFVDILARDHKDRWLMALDLETGGLTLLDRQHDEAWISGPGIRWGDELGWAPDNKHIWFKSEVSGYSHLYSVDVTTGAKEALTSGEFEVSDVSLSHDKKSWYFTSNEIHPGEKHFYSMPLKGGKPTQITSMTGRSRVTLSPDQKTLALLYSYTNKPWELYVMPNRAGATARRLTHSTTAEFESYDWRDPEIVTFSSNDGAKVYARLYRPEKPEATGPAVIFVHGAGYLQNAHKWWSSYYREYMFHNFLADNGYTVLDIDYRASAGYGRDWRTAIYRHMGGKDLSDQVDGAKFLVDKYRVDSARIGMYGGSYGGFIAFMAMFTEPGIFAAAAALRPVSDWAHYNHGYTSGILNIPQSDSIAFVRSSPIYHAEGLEGALLICHGVVDRNVHFQDVVRLTQRLIELEKDNWEVAFYPVEGHGFREPSSWRDEYTRIFNLFEENLK